VREEKELSRKGERGRILIGGEGGTKGGKDAPQPPQSLTARVGSVKRGSPFPQRRRGGGWTEGKKKVEALMCRKNSSASSGHRGGGLNHKKKRGGKSSSLGRIFPHRGKKGTVGVERGPRRSSREETKEKQPLMKEKGPFRKKTHIFEGGGKNKDRRKGGSICLQRLEGEKN